MCIVGGRDRGRGETRGGSAVDGKHARARARVHAHPYSHTHSRTHARSCALVCEWCCACRVGGVYGRNGPRPLRVPPRRAEETPPPPPPTLLPGDDVAALRPPSLAHTRRSFGARASARAAADPARVSIACSALPRGAPREPDDGDNKFTYH